MQLCGSLNWLFYLLCAPCNKPAGYGFVGLIYYLWVTAIQLKWSELQKTSTLQARFAGTTHLRNCAKTHYFFHNFLQKTLVAGLGRFEHDYDRWIPPEGVTWQKKVNYIPLQSVSNYWVEQLILPFACLCFMQCF